MRRFLPQLASLAVLAMLLAACNTQLAQPAADSLDEVLHPAVGAGITALALPNWTSDDELTVDVIGMGLGNSQSGLSTAHLDIADPSNVVKVYVQVVTKAGTSGEGTYPDPTEVTITANDAADVVMETKTLTGLGVERAAIESEDGTSGTTGYSHEAEFSGAVASVDIEISDNAVTGFPQSPRALIVSVFRDLGDASASAGLLPNVYVFGNDQYPTAEETIALPAEFPGGDITVTFAISDLELFSRASDFTLNDPRIVYYGASAGGVSASQKLDVPNMGADLAIVQLVLADVPAGTASVTANIYSPSREAETPHGDSVYWNNVSLTFTTPDGGTEGCTPGYWRQEHHFDSWTGYTPDQLFSDVFDRVITVGTGGRTTASDPTLLQAVWANGGGVNALARHATAALLNSASVDVDYPYTTAQVIAMVQAAIDSGDHEATKDLLGGANELGCPLN